MQMIRKAEYIGETGKNSYDRGKQHLADMAQL